MNRLIFTYILLLVTACSMPAEYRQTVGYELHTPYHIKYKYTRQLDNEIRSRLQAYYHSINAFDSTSVISKINRNESTTPDSIFIDIFNKSREVAEATGGLFDATCAPLINLWGFGFTKGEIISPESIQAAMRLVGYEKVRLENGQIIKDNPGIMLNFSALGDGYSCDLIASLFDSLGINDYCIEIGGEIVVSGKNPKGEYWKIGIVEPAEGSNAENQTITRIVELKDKCGLATSGDYRNFREMKGEKYGHEINPQTGYPAGSDIISATVVATDGITADAYATAFMVMGSKTVEEFMKDNHEMEYFIICKTSDTTVIFKTSPGF